LSNYHRKCVLLILDGLGDLPVSDLHGQTPLEAANTPVLDRLAGSGLYGLVDPIRPGKIPNTHSGCGALLGALPAQLSRLKRGPVEAAGAGLTLQPGEIAVRANFATLENQQDDLLVVDRRAGRISADTVELAAFLKTVDLGDGVTARLQSTDQHRCVLVLSGPGLDPRISDTDPGDGATPALLRPCLPLAAAAALTAEKINHFVATAHHRLASHPVNQERIKAGKLPANGVITRGAGVAFRLENVIRDRGLNPAVVAGCNTVIGLSRTLGFEVKTDPRFTAAANTDLLAKMETAVAALENHDLVYVHIKAPDLFAHDHQPENKRDFIELCDEALEMLEQAGVMIAVAADHSTDSNSGAHTADPVPALLYSPSARSSGTHPPISFGEKTCSKGNMTRQSSHQFLLRLLDMMVGS
jgi:2,3-bisphosphoglycerate-independent phosphoglycerate mutase